MVTEVCLTIDIEFSVGGAFTWPDTHRPIGEESVLCHASGQENGLGFLLDVLSDHGISATFFVESLQSAYFGDAPMGRIIERILRHGQDVQLHIHPAWRAFRKSDWRLRTSGLPPNDFCDGRSLADMRDVIGDGLACLGRVCGTPPIAMRTGNLHGDRTVYLAMAACGLKVASNVGAGWWMPDDPTLRLWGGRSRVGGVLEIPVTTYDQGRKGHPRLLTTAGASLAETKALLWQAREEAVPTVVVLTHAFDFLGRNRLRAGGPRANRLVKRRMEKVCAFIADNPREFAAVSFAQAAPAWLDAPDVRPPSLTVPLVSVLSRIVQNGTNELILAL
ncbi:MAG: hypothetical protein ABI369_03335 [Acetobacteraceae bacterium]